MKTYISSQATSLLRAPGFVDALPGYVLPDASSQSRLPLIIHRLRQLASQSFLPSNTFERQESERFRCFPDEDLLKRDKLSLDIRWLRDESLEDIDNLADPAILAAEIVEDLQAARDQFALIAADLAKSTEIPKPLPVVD